MNTYLAGLTLITTALLCSAPVLWADAEKTDSARATPLAAPSKAVADLEAAASDAVDSGNSGRAIELLHQAAALTDPNRNVEEWTRVRNSLFGRLIQLGKFEELEAVAKQAILEGDKALGAEHPTTVRIRFALEKAMKMQRQFKEAEEPIRTQLATRERELGPKHPDTLASRGRLAELLVGLGKHAEAEALYSQIVKVREQELGPEHEDTLKSHMVFALIYSATEKWTEGKEQAQKAFAGYHNTLGDENQKTKDAKKIIEMCDKKLAKKKP